MQATPLTTKTCLVDVHSMRLCAMAYRVSDTLTRGGIDAAASRAKRQAQMLIMAGGVKQDPCFDLVTDGPYPFKLPGGAA